MPVNRGAENASWFALTPHAGTVLTALRMGMTAERTGVLDEQIDRLWTPGGTPYRGQRRPGRGGHVTGDLQAYPVGEPKRHSMAAIADVSAATGRT